MSMKYLHLLGFYLMEQTVLREDDCPQGFSEFKLSTAGLEDFCAAYNVITCKASNLIELCRLMTFYIYAFNS